MASFEWTDERISVLASMLAQGEMYSAIARRLRTTRNACLGKADRLGLSACARRRKSIYQLDGEGVPVAEIALRLLLQPEAVRLILDARDDNDRVQKQQYRLREEQRIRRNETQRIARRARHERDRLEAAERAKARAERPAPTPGLQAAIDRAEALASGKSPLALIAANRLHLYDLKQAGYCAADTECAGERDTLPAFVPRQLQTASYCGSPAAMCAGN